MITRALLLIGIFNLFFLSAQKELIVHFPFNNSTEEISSNKYKAELEGSVSYSLNQNNKENGAIEFYDDKGNESTLTITEISSFNDQEFSISFWYKPVFSTYDYAGGMITKAYKNKYLPIFQISSLFHKFKSEHHSECVSLKIESYDSNKKMNRVRVMIDTNWHHITITAKAKDYIRLYVDGKEKGNTKMEATSFFGLAHTLKISSADYYIAPNSNSIEKIGPISDFKVCNSALSMERISGLMEEKEIPIAIAPPPIQDESDQFPNRSIQYDLETGIFSNQIEGNPYTFSLPDRLSYQSHKEFESGLIITYKWDVKNDNYIGLWDKKLNYKYEYKLGQLEAISYLYDQKWGLYLHFKDVKYGTYFVALFDQNLKYIAQYEVSSLKNVSLKFSAKGPIVEFTEKNKVDQIQLDGMMKEMD